MPQLQRRTDLWPASASTSTRSRCCATRDAPVCRTCARSRASRIEAGARGITVHPQPGRAAHPPLRRTDAGRGYCGVAPRRGAEHRGLSRCAAARDRGRGAAGAVHAGARCAGCVHFRGGFQAWSRADGAGASRHRDAEVHRRAGHPVHRSRSRGASIEFPQAVPMASRSTQALMQRRSARALTTHASTPARRLRAPRRISGWL